MPRILSLVAVLLSVWTLGAQAGDVKVVRNAGDTVDPAEVAQILARPPVKMRSLRLLDDAPAGSAVAATAAVAAAAAAAQAAGPSTLSLPVPFAFDSAEILPGAKAQLDAVAAGIRLLPATQKVVIEGHTDAIGGDAYNETLSTRRAESVRRYLVAAHGIDAGRLEAVGKGKADPLPGRDPKAGENRRVQFRGG